jgi:hypothetical protein
MVYSHGTLGATPGQLVTTLTSVMLNSVSEERSPSRPNPIWGEDQGRPHRSTQPIHLGRRPVSGRPNPTQLRRRPVTGRPSSVHQGRRQGEGTTHSQIDPTHCPGEKIWRVSSQVDPTHYSGEKTWRDISTTWVTTQRSLGTNPVQLISPSISVILNSVHRGVSSQKNVSRSCNHQYSLLTRGAFHSKFITEVLELRLGKRLGENICNLLICRKVLH